MDKKTWLQSIEPSNSSYAAQFDCHLPISKATQSHGVRARSMTIEGVMVELSWPMDQAQLDDVFNNITPASFIAYPPFLITPNRVWMRVDGKPTVGEIALGLDSISSPSPEYITDNIQLWHVGDRGGGPAKCPEHWWLELDHAYHIEEVLNSRMQGGDSDLIHFVDDQGRCVTAISTELARELPPWVLGRAVERCYDRVM